MENFLNSFEPVEVGLSLRNERNEISKGLNKFFWF